MFWLCLAEIDPKYSEIGSVYSSTCAHVSSIDLWTEAGELRTHICDEWVTVLATEKGFMERGPTGVVEFYYNSFTPNKNGNKCNPQRFCLIAPSFFHPTVAASCPIGLPATSSWAFADSPVWWMEGGSFNDGHYVGLELGCCVYLLAGVPYRLVCLW